MIDIVVSLLTFECAVAKLGWESRVWWWSFDINLLCVNGDRSLLGLSLLRYDRNFKHIIVRLLFFTFKIVH